MINFDDIIKENIKQHNPNLPQIPDHPCKILIVGGSGSGKTSLLFNPINQHQILMKFTYMLKIHKKEYINF